MSKLTPDPLASSPDERSDFMEVFDCTHERRTLIPLTPSIVCVNECLPTLMHAGFFHVCVSVMLIFDVCVCMCKCECTCMIALHAYLRVAVSQQTMKIEFGEST